jgi:hypothetical protein
MLVPPGIQTGLYFITRMISDGAGKICSKFAQKSDKSGNQMAG